MSIEEIKRKSLSTKYRESLKEIEHLDQTIKDKMLSFADKMIEKEQTIENQANRIKELEQKLYGQHKTDYLKND